MKAFCNKTTDKLSVDFLNKQLSRNADVIFFLVCADCCSKRKHFRYIHPCLFAQNKINMLITAWNKRWTERSMHDTHNCPKITWKTCTHDTSQVAQWHRQSQWRSPNFTPPVKFTPLKFSISNFAHVTTSWTSNTVSNFIAYPQMCEILRFCDLLLSCPAYTFF